MKTSPVPMPLLLEAERRRRTNRDRLSVWAADPLALAAAARIHLDPWQESALRDNHKTLLLNCGRQVGKSTCTALIIVQELLREDSMTIIVTPSERQSKELLRKVLKFWRLIGRPIAAVAATKTSLELINGSRIEAFPGSSDTIVGMSGVTLLVADEAARIPDELIGSVTPMLATTDGRQVHLTTPRGRQGYFYHLWVTPAEDDPSIGRVSIPTAECPRVTPVFLARELRRLGERQFGEWYECKFQDAELGVFRGIEAACDAPSNAVRVAYHQYVIGVDWGRTHDYTVFSVIDTYNMMQVEMQRFTDIPYALQRQRLHELARRWGTENIVAEANSMGRPVLEELQYEGLPVYPFETSNASKMRIMDQLSLAIETGSIHLLDDPTQKAELYDYTSSRTPTGLVKYEGGNGSHDDTVMALAICLDASRSAQPSLDEDVAEDLVSFRGY